MRIMHTIALAIPGLEVGETELHGQKVSTLSFPLDQFEKVERALTAELAGAKSDIDAYQRLLADMEFGLHRQVQHGKRPGAAVVLSIGDWLQVRCALRDAGDDHLADEVAAQQERHHDA